ncbi:OHCU decarboxylase [Aeromicrobium flavum]|uniref:2-oxo-4-hydroxy-4-carboxy-5-ureidoimidazoline decarboxylase n=1 Tax=Aeromicrobium flavum TaxID=416568 RepID=A0A512HVC0_9ACTN|nr:2-oxo-4-hydroxy-4-carboxy-5-ureidoimidazoline decarboxylase [Aeromicrobium flavum]GEO89394.1 OHCU decarboxylase [Aeromicrobium flavum]
MDITTFDAADAATASALVRTCAKVDSWVAAVVAGRPYGTVDAVLAQADALASGWGAAEVAEALADHPRIGEKPHGDGASAELSRSEQSGVDTDRDTAVRLAAGNRRYERRFDRIFLVRAAGRSAEEILQHLERRLENDPETELAVTAGQLREIAALRLEGILS